MYIVNLGQKQCYPQAMAPKQFTSLLVRFRVILQAHATLP
jgi:hypothetical protein